MRPGNKKEMRCLSAGGVFSCRTFSPLCQLSSRSADLAPGGDAEIGFTPLDGGLWLGGAMEFLIAALL